jgi:N6-L-threonylcarbamoyladenine synthase
MRTTMTILGIESSCDECAAAVVLDGRRVVSSVVATQLERHAEFDGVVPEIASRLHTEWIEDVVARSLGDAGVSMAGVDGLAVTSRPGLAGSLLVGVSFAKALAWSTGKPFVGVNHVLAHLYAPLLSEDVAYPFIGLMVSGGHTLICRADGFDDITVLGTTIDDAIGEAFDKVAKHYGFGYPGGSAIDAASRRPTCTRESTATTFLTRASRPRRYASSTSSGTRPTSATTATWPPRSRKPRWTCSFRACSGL